MSEPAVLYSAEAGVATLTMNRPQVLNALNDELLSGLRQGLARAKADADIRAVLLTGTGRGFCAGADLAAGPGVHAGPVAARCSAPSHGTHRSNPHDPGPCAALPKPIVAP